MINKFKTLVATLSAASILALGIFTHVNAQTSQNQFPTTGWSGYAPANIQCGQLYGANFNVTTDQAIPITVPTNIYMIDSITITNPSTSMTTAAGGFYSATSKGGVAIVGSGQAYSALTTTGNTANTTGNALKATISTAGLTTNFNSNYLTSPNAVIYLSLSTAQGAAATADIRVRCSPLY